MESNQAQAASIQIVKTNESVTITKEQKQRESQSQPKPTKKRYISKQSMAFMHVREKPSFILRFALHATRRQQKAAMETSQQPSGKAASIQLVKEADNTTASLKLQKQVQREPQSQPKPVKKRYISKQSMAFMHC